MKECAGDPEALARVDFVRTGLTDAAYVLETQADLVSQNLRVVDIPGKVLKQRQILPGSCRIAEDNCPRVPIHVPDR